MSLELTVPQDPQDLPNAVSIPVDEDDPVCTTCKTPYRHVCRLDKPVVTVDEDGGVHVYRDLDVNVWVPACSCPPEYTQVDY